MTPAERIAYVSHRLTTHLHDIGAVPLTLSKFSWSNATLPDPSNLHRMYGWVPPYTNENVSHPEDCPCSACADHADVETVVAPFSPELIVDQSRFLDDEHFTMYVDTIEWSVSMHITHRTMPWEEREAFIDKQLFDVAEDSMSLQNDVQMKILDGVNG
jgi:hypothetical protein